MQVLLLAALRFMCYSVPQAKIRTYAEFCCFKWNRTVTWQCNSRITALLVIYYSLPQVTNQQTDQEVCQMNIM
jgi:hypothetical protein